MRSLIPAFALIFASTAAQAQEIVEVPASKANVARPDDLFNLPPGQWHMAKSLAAGSEPCAADQCEAGFTSGDLVFARHILFAVTPGAPIALIREQAEQVLQEARTHADRFSALAGQYSNCPSAQQGGSLGQLGRGDCVPEFEQALFEGRATGVLPRLVKTRFGFHIVAVDQRVPGKTVPYEAVREQIAARLYARVQEKALAQYVQVLAGVFAVEIPGVAAAASPLVQ